MNKEDLIKEYQELKELVSEIDEVRKKLWKIMSIYEEFTQWHQECFSKKFTEDFYRIDNEILDFIVEDERFCNKKLEPYKNPNALPNRINRKLEKLTSNEKDD